MITFGFILLCTHVEGQCEVISKKFPTKEACEAEVQSVVRNWEDPDIYIKNSICKVVGTDV